MNDLKILWDKSFTDYRYRIALHLVFWIILLFFWMGESMVVKINTTQHIAVTLTGILFITYLYYPLVYFIFPLFKKKKWALGIFAFLIYYVIAVILRTYHITLLIQWYNFHQIAIQGGDFWQKLLEKNIGPGAFSKIIFSGLSSLILNIYIPLSIKFMRYAYQFSEQQAWMLKENTQLQLNTLKAQINPHFFFNTLNNLQSFIVQNEKEKSVNLLNKLADFMRSSLYDSDQEYIGMDKEIELLSNYISIESVRFEDEAAIHYHLDQTFPNYQIPPFIFLPFIENAFKHGGLLPTAEVNIDIELIHTSSKLILNTKNSFVVCSQNKLHHGGIGLQNVRKRLDHYFPNRYQLKTAILNNQYIVNLEINK